MDSEKSKDQKHQTSQPVQFDEFVSHATDFFDEVTSGRDVTVERDGKMVRLSPVRRSGKRSTRRFLASDPLWDIVGIGQSTGPTDVSTNKHSYLANAVANLHQPDEAPTQAPEHSPDNPPDKS